MKLTLANGILLAAIGWIGYQTATGKPIVPDLAPVPDDSPATPAAGTSFPLARGSRGAHVRALQKHLGIPVDGVFGVQTENALRARHGKSSVASQAELNAWLGAAGATAAATKPAAVKPAASQPVTKTDPYGSFPLKLGRKGQYVRNLQQWLGLKIDGQFGAGTQAALKAKTGQVQVDSLEQLNYLLTGKSAAATPAAPATVPPNWAELDRIFRAFWTVQPKFTNVVALRTFADKDALLAVLKPKTDAQLRAFIVQYNSSYKAWKGVNASRPTPTLAGDFSQLTIIGGSSLATLRDRVARLSIAR